MSTAGHPTAPLTSQRLLLVRHRQSTWNAERRWASQADPPLSERGEADAAALGPVLAPLGFSAVVSSDLSRARQTAVLIRAAMPWTTLSEDPRLREIDVPAWTGRTKADIEVAFAGEYARWRSGVRVPPAGSEPWEQFEERVLAGLQACADRGDTVLVVAHSGVLRAVGTALHFAKKVGRSKGIWVHRSDGLLTVGTLKRLTTPRA